MTKLLSTFIFSFTSFFVTAQMGSFSAYSAAVGKARKESVDELRKTETIFVLPVIYPTETYERILEEVWTITPYRLVDIADFDIEDYLDGKHSIVHLTATVVDRTSSTSSTRLLYTLFRVDLFDGEDIKEKLAKWSDKQERNKRDMLFANNRETLAYCLVTPDAEYVMNLVDLDLRELRLGMYRDTVFYQFTPGIIKNYLQKMHQLISDREEYEPYSDTYKPDLASLMKDTLVVPAATAIRYDGWRIQDKDQGEEYIHELFAKYRHPYRIEEDEVISERILAGEEFYYLRYSRLAASRFLEIVNAATGDVVYRKYHLGLSYQLKDSHFQDISKSVEKAWKKSGK